jgi:hypothetical protein
VVLAGADIATADSLQYIYRPVPVGALHFDVRAPSNAHIALTSANHETEPMYEILLGGWENTASVIRYNQQKPDKVQDSFYIVLCQVEQKKVSHSRTGIIKTYISEGYVILSPTQLIISLLLILADRQHVLALFKLPSSGLPVDNCYTKIPCQWDPIM